MRLTPRGGSVPESRQEVIGFYGHESSHKIQAFIDRYAVRVVALWAESHTDDLTVWVLFEEEN